MTYTRDEALDHGFDVFEAALGSLTTATDVETGWKNLFYNKVGWNLDFVNANVVYLEGLCQWMGNYIVTSLIVTGNQVKLSDVLKAYRAVQAYAYSQNGDSPTVLC